MTNILPLANTSIKYSPSISNPNLNPNYAYKLPTGAVDSIQKVGQAADPQMVPAKMLLSLLKSGLNDTKADEKIFQGRTHEDWVNMYNLSIESAVTPTLMNGLEKNPNIKVPEDVAANMKASKEFALKYHGLQEKLLGEFSDFTKSKGIDTVQMKGIGFSMNYPEPTARFGGDLDVFNYKHGTNPADMKNNMSFETDKLAAKAGMKVALDHGPKHSEIRYKGMPIENHRNFLNAEIAPISDKMNKYLFKHLKPVQETLPHGTKILVPSKEFNNVFISYHAMQHYVGGGINFHHLADWAMQVKKHGLTIPEEAKGTKYEQFMYAFTNLANKHLGTNVKVPENKKLEDDIFRRMVHIEDKMGFNIEPPKHKNPVSMTVYKFKKFAAQNNRRNEFYEINKPLSKAIVESFIKHVKNPKTFINFFTKVK